MSEMPHHAQVGYIVWAILFAALFAWEGIGLLHPVDSYPTLSQALGATMRHQFGRWALFTAWLWFGWHAFVQNWHFLLRGPGPVG
ncbi:DUF6186 family protein [Streptomyces sp. NPDC127098]|uniref:DUF6186 family protein n=1 Tax=Streptomyces sp. NPDC127098 TaxID=3347137 RepID=UPI003652F61E